MRSFNLKISNFELNQLGSVPYQFLGELHGYQSITLAKTVYNLTALLRIDNKEFEIKEGDQLDIKDKRVDIVTLLTPFQIYNQSDINEKELVFLCAGCDEFVGVKKRYAYGDIIAKAQYSADTHTQEIDLFNANQVLNYGSNAPYADMPLSLVYKVSGLSALAGSSLIAGSPLPPRIHIIDQYQLNEMIPFPGFGGIGVGVLPLRNSIAQGVNGLRVYIPFDGADSLWVNRRGSIQCELVYGYFPEKHEFTWFSGLDASISIPGGGSSFRTIDYLSFPSFASSVLMHNVGSTTINSKEIYFWPNTVLGNNPDFSAASSSTAAAATRTFPSLISKFSLYAVGREGAGGGAFSVGNRMRGWARH